MIRLVQYTDAEELYNLVDKNRFRLREWMNWVDATKSVKDIEKFIENTLKGYIDKTQMNHVLLNGEKIIGVVGYNIINSTNRNGEIGYWIDSDFSGKGLMTRGVKELIEYGINKLKLHRIMIKAATGNKKSRSIPERLNFRHEGTLKEAEWLYDHFVDLEVYEILEYEWISFNN